MVVSAARRWTTAALDLLLPPRCPACGALTDSVGGVCPVCWTRLTFIAPPLCDGCGMPFAVETEAGARCGACLRQPRVFDRARAALVYNDGSRGLILAFKHGDRTHTTGTFARWMLAAAGPLVAQADLIAPVPLHWTRLFLRRYNQAALLALAVGKLAARPVVPDLLVRFRRTPKLGHMNPGERRRTVARVFRVASRHRGLVSGRRVLLIDDVLTTGATVDSCARQVLNAGASAVDVLALARVVRPLT